MTVSPLPQDVDNFKQHLEACPQLIKDHIGLIENDRNELMNLVRNLQVINNFLRDKAKGK